MEFTYPWYFGLHIPKRWMGLFIIKDGTNWHDVWESLHTYVLFKFLSLKNTEEGIFSQGIVENLAISFKLYKLNPSMSSIFAVLIQEIGVFTSSNTSVASYILFSFVLEKYIVCDVCGLRSPSCESRGELYITPTSGAVKTQYWAFCVKSMKLGKLMYFFYAESFKKGTQGDWPLVWT